MKARIKDVRKSLGLNQSDFGKAVGLTGAAISRIESGDRNPSEMFIRAICDRFNISRKWLETGEGEMRIVPSSDDEIVSKVLAGDDEFIKAVIRGIAKTPGGWEKMREVFTAIQKELQKIPPKD